MVERCRGVSTLQHEEGWPHTERSRTQAWVCSAPTAFRHVDSCSDHRFDRSGLGALRQDIADRMSNTGREHRRTILVPVEPSRPWKRP